MAAIPETCGHDMEVSEIMFNRGGALPSGALTVINDCSVLGIQGERSFTLMKFHVRSEGPLPEKYAIAGAGL